VQPGLAPDAWRDSKAGGEIVVDEPAEEAFPEPSPLAPEPAAEPDATEQAAAPEETQPMESGPEKGMANPTLLLPQIE